MKKTFRFFLAFLCLMSFSRYSFAVDENWDIIDKSMAAWNQDGGSDNNNAWKVTKSYITATQKEGYVNIQRLSGADGYITPTGFPTINKSNPYTIEIKAKVNATGKTDTQTIFESNQIGITIGGKMIKLYLKHGDENNGYISYTQAYQHDDDEKFILNTSDWHVYRIVYFPANFTCDVYVDDSEYPLIKGLKTHYNGTKNEILIGADKDRYSNMDIEYVKFGMGNFALKTQITSLGVSSDSHVAGNARTITATVNTDMVTDGQKIFLGLYDESDTEVISPTELTVSGNTVVTQFSIPAPLPIGKYSLKAFAADNKIGDVNVKPVSMDYYIVDESPIALKIFPQIKTEDFAFVIKMDDYIYQPPTKEFIFPCIVDTRKYIGSDGKFLNGEEPLDRYYWFQAPHDDPGGIFLNTAPTLDGPWTERNVILSNEWAKAQGINTSHISSSHVMWNTVYNKYFIYFHGNNDRSHYATSDDMINWTYGAQIVQYDDFSFSAREASYARVFEYEVPGYNNKYVLFLMINENNSRTIYWAHSTDGKTWKGVRKPLISPKLAYKKIPGTNTKPSYQENVSGPFFMKVDGRYFVFFHSTAGNISVVEIGEKFDMEVHWGEYLKKSEVIIDENESGELQAVTRVASPFFIQNDEGAWYLFIESGHRLGSNTAYSKGEATIVSIKDTENDKKGLYNIYKSGEELILNNITSDKGTFQLYDSTGRLVQNGTMNPGENKLKANKGLYIVKVSLNNEISTVKTLK